MPVDTRHKNRNWSVPTRENGQVQTWEGVRVALLMDLRDELQQLNSLLSYYNFTDIPNILRGVRRNTAKPKEKK